jgi:hypothetical protein
MQCCVSGSGRIGIILQDQNLYQFQPKKNKLYFFPENFEDAVQKTEIFLQEATSKGIHWMSAAKTDFRGRPLISW